jgi:hypothetical protein
MALELRVVQEEAQAPLEEPEPVVYQKNLLEKETETSGCTTRSENMDSMSGSGVSVEEEGNGKSVSSNTTCQDIRIRQEVRS